MTEKLKFLIVGAGGRECAFAQRLADETALYAVVSHENPAIVDAVERSGGHYIVGNASDPGVVTGFAVEHAIDYAFINSDDPLANGVVDALLEAGIKAVGGTREACRVEWDKIYSIELMNEVCPEHTPYFKVVKSKNEINDALNLFRQKKLDVVVKPQGLTGGKGVKVMPHHLSTYDDCVEYIESLLTDKPDESVLLVERLSGIEFTIMGLTDGEHVMSTPATYDYPYRYEDDTGPGTGGMGCFTGPNGQLPFLNDDDVRTCEKIMKAIVGKLKDNDLNFSGVLNGGFFKTPNGIKFMEFNARFGDPECLNILMVLKGSFAKLLISMYEKTLAQHKIEFAAEASVTKYLVAPEYPEPSPEASNFSVDTDKAKAMGAKLFFASCIKDGDHYATIKKSRVIAVGTTAETIDKASKQANSVIEECIGGAHTLDYRADIASTESLSKLRPS